jgi:hypothetical protein
VFQNNNRSFTHALFLGSPEPRFTGNDLAIGSN